jgi:hypothetical protein
MTTSTIDLQDTEFPELESIDLHSIIKNKIVSLYFNLTRKTEWDAIHELAIEFDSLLDLIFKEIRKNIGSHIKLQKSSNSEIYDKELDTKKNQLIAEIFVLKIYLSYLFKLIAQTRDIVHGKGERDLTYMLISVWYNYLPIPAMFALRLITQNMEDSSASELPELFSSYGSWSDIKYFCNYVHTRETDEKKKNVLIDTALGLLNHQLAVDKRNWDKAMDDYINDSTVNTMSLKTRPCGRDIMSFAAKWSPREKSKFDWMFDRLAEQYCALYLEKDEYIAKNDNIDKKKRYYRKLVSRLNRELDTVQIKQCSNRWADINPENVSITTMMKQNNAFMNMNHGRKYRKKKTVNLRSMLSTEDDRETCASNFREFYNDVCNTEFGSIENENKTETETETETEKPRRNKKTVVSISEYVKNAIQISESRSAYKSNDENDDLGLQIQWLNHSWKKVIMNSYPINAHKGYDIPILDISCDLSATEIHTAIGIAILVAQRSRVPRIMISDHNPEWIMIQEHDEFTDIVQRIYTYVNHATDFNITKSFDLIYQSIDSTGLSTNEISRIHFVIITRFVDHSNLSWKQLFDDFYIKTNTEPYMIYWNINEHKMGVHSVNELIEMKEKMLLLSGGSFSMLEYFNKFGMEGTRKMTPYQYILEILDAPRYNPMGEYFEHYLTPMIQKQIQLL